MNKQFRFILVLAVMLALVVPAMAQDDMMAWECPEGFEGETLSVFNWATYIADNTIPDFEDACGVSVDYSIFGSADEALAILRGGNPGYDIVVPSDFIVAIMAEEGLIQELDQSMIPNLDNVSPRFETIAYDPGFTFSVPYQWGTIGIGYSTEAFPDGITSWEDLWAHDGNVAWIEESRSMLGIGLLMLGEDPNTTDEDLLEDSAEYLTDNGENVVAIAADDGQALLERGDVDAAVEYNGDIYQVIFDCECEDFAYIVPEEGAVAWTDAMVIPSDAPNAELAHVFIDYILDPQVGADLSNFTAYGSPNQAAIDMGLIDEELLNDPGIYPTAEIEEGLFEVRELPEIEDIVNDLWDEIKIEVGG
ncbi:MAG: spermidine/putrescine ABC transporter substrate-binding protein [Chloroflexota bacterium]